MFVAEQGGKIRTVRAGKILPKAFLNISAKVGRASAERGLLGLAFHPKYKTNGLFDVNYTDLTGATVIAEYRRSSQRDRALPDSERIIIRIELTALNHNGGMVAFGPDGYLYIGMGDSGGIGDPLAAAQRLDTLLGKILRIDVDTPTGNGRPPVVGPVLMRVVDLNHGLQAPPAGDSVVAWRPPAEA